MCVCVYVPYLYDHITVRNDPDLARSVFFFVCSFVRSFVHFCALSIVVGFFDWLVGTFFCLFFYSFVRSFIRSFVAWVVCENKLVGLGVLVMWRCSVRERGRESAIESEGGKGGELDVRFSCQNGSAPR